MREKGPGIRKGPHGDSLSLFDEMKAAQPHARLRPLGLPAALRDEPVAGAEAVLRRGKLALRAGGRPACPVESFPQLLKGFLLGGRSRRNRRLWRVMRRARAPEAATGRAVAWPPALGVPSRPEPPAAPWGAAGAGSAPSAPLGTPSAPPRHPLGSAPVRPQLGSPARLPSSAPRLQCPSLGSAPRLPSSAPRGGTLLSYLDHAAPRGPSR